MIRDLFPLATLSDRTALALFAWHAILSNGSVAVYEDGERIAREAYKQSDAMLAEFLRQEAQQ